jgi:dTDP-glucose 4,6-dehydratase
MKGRSVLVTGAGGFIGSHVAERLVQQGARVRVLCRYTSSGSIGMLEDADTAIVDAIEVVFGDIRDRDNVARAMVGVDAVVHLAAHISVAWSETSPREFFEANVGGTINIAQGCLAEGVERVVMLSTSEVYGEAQHVPMPESHPIVPQSPYAASKASADAVTTAFVHTYGLPAVTVRPFNTYGPRQSTRAVVPTIIRQALAGPVVRLGETSTRRDLTFVIDSADGIIAALDADGAVGQTINLGTGAEASIEEIVRNVEQHVGHELRIERDESRVRRPAMEVNRLIADNGLARSVLGWEPTTSLDDGLVRAIEWYAALDAPYREQLR